MKKTSLARRNALLSSAGFSWGMRALGVVVFIVAVRFLAPDALWSVLTPAYRGADALGAASHEFLASFADAAALKLENEQLRANNALLAGQNQALAQEIVDLKKIAVSDDTMGLVAAVVARPPVSAYDTLVVDVGEKEGVAAGDEVLGPGGVPVGVVASVSEKFAYVVLFSAPGMSVVSHVGAESVPVTLSGNGAGTFLATVARAADIQEGDTVFAPGPPAPPIGTVARVDDDPSSPAVILYVRPAINPFSINWVRIRPAPPSFMSSVSFTASTLP